MPGYHHGRILDSQLDWLRDVLAEPAPDGTLLALHHPPIPSPIELMAILELEEQHRLADVIRGTDVRAILAGHLHYSTSGTFAGIPVSVAAATCYVIDNSAAAGQPGRHRRRPVDQPRERLRGHRGALDHPGARGAAGRRVRRASCSTGSPR